VIFKFQIYIILLSLHQTTILGIMLVGDKPLIYSSYHFAILFTKKL